MMPELIGISEFINETRDDYNSPITSTFVSRMPQCRNTITSLEEVMFSVSVFAYLLHLFPGLIITKWLHIAVTSSGILTNCANFDAPVSPVPSRI